MKGPRSRTRHVAWRQWQCPQCGKNLWTASQVAQQRCACGEPEPWMVPVEAKSKRKSGFGPLESAPVAAPSIDATANVTP